MGYKTRQVFDLPKVQIKVTEYRAEIKSCACCGKETQSTFPREVSKAVQYGPEIKARMAYLNTEQHLPLERTCVLLDEFYNHRPSEGTIVTACAEAAQKVEKSNQAVKEHGVEQEAVAHFDETGIVINSVLHWLHTASTLRLTYLRLIDHLSESENHLGGFRLQKSAYNHIWKGSIYATFQTLAL